MAPLQVPDQLCYPLRKSQAPGWWPRVIGHLLQASAGHREGSSGGWAVSPEADGHPFAH